MMRRGVLSLVLGMGTTSALAQEAPTDEPPEAQLPAAPEEGLDADLAATMDKARAALEHGDATRAAEMVIRMHLSTDRFTQAQAAALKGPSLKLLGDAAQLQLQGGHIELAAQALDAAWELDGRKRDPEYARVLVAWTGKLQASNEAQALYLARRALEADPGNSTAAAFDFSLSHNKYLVPGRALEITGLAGFAAGAALLYLGSSQQSANESSTIRNAGIGGLVVGSLAYLGAYYLLSAGERRFAPTSPALLPTLAK